MDLFLHHYSLTPVMWSHTQRGSNRLNEWKWEGADLHTKKGGMAKVEGERERKVRDLFFIWGNTSACLIRGNGWADYHRGNTLSREWRVGERVRGRNEGGMNGQHWGLTQRKWGKTDWSKGRKNVWREKGTKKVVQYIHNLKMLICINGQL